MILATGTENSGLSLFVQNDRLLFDYNCFGEHHVVVSTRPVPDGASKVGVQFRRGPGKGGDATLVIDEEPCGSVTLPFVMRIISSIGPSVGFDHGSPVSERYAGAFPFAGRIDRVDIQLVSTRGEAGNAIADERATMARQ